jgi:prepilin-type N-terminal cleavage/methylation domain-containing protein
MKKNNFRKKSETESIHETNSQRGFSMIEVIVSMVLFLIVTGSVFGLLRIARFDRNRSSDRADIMKNARTAINIIGRDAVNAGLGYHRTGAIVPNNFISTRLGIPPNPGTDRDILTSVIAGNNIFSNNIQEDSTIKTDTVAFAFRDLDFNPGGSLNSGQTISLSGVTAVSSGTTARIQTVAGQGAAVNNYDLYLIESDSSQVGVMATTKVDNSNIDFASGDPLGFNQAFNGTGSNGSLLKKCTTTITDNCTTYLASLKRFFWISYKVKPDGTLVRTLFGNNTGQPSTQQIQELPIAYNVKNLQFRYVLKDGTVTDNPSAGPDGIAGTTDDVSNNMNLVRQITVTLQVASTEVDEQTRKPIVITLNGTFSLRNLEYDAG